jgi:hypothetical protein
MSTCVPRFVGIRIPRCEIQEQEFILHQENKKKKKKTQMILDSIRGSTRTRTSSMLQKERTQDKTNPTKSIFKKETLNCIIIYMQVEDNKEILTLTMQGTNNIDLPLQRKTFQNHKELIAQSRMQTPVTNRIHSLHAASQIPEVSGNKENR